MWRSVVAARRCATSCSITNLVLLQVHHVITSPINSNLSTSLNPRIRFYSTNPNETNQLFDENIEESGQNPASISQINEHFDGDFGELGQNPASDSVTNQHFDEKFGELRQDPLSVSPEIIDENKIEDELVANEVDLEQLDSVLSLLQSTQKRDSSLASALDELKITSLNEDFVVKVLETPLVPSENLINFFKWGLKKTESFSPTSRSFEALVRVISGQKIAYAVWDLIKEAGETKNSEENRILTTPILNELISALSKIGKAKAVLEVFDKFDELGCVHDSDTYYLAIDVLCRRSFHNWACLVVEKMKNSGNLPEGEKVGKIISYLCKGEKNKEAHSIYLLAKEKNKLLPHSAINFLISSLSRDEKTVRLGLEMLGDFSEEERKYEIKTFSAVVRGLCKNKEVGMAKDLLFKMIAEGPPPGNAIFNSIISGLSKSGEMGEAKEMVKMMENRGLKPDVFTYTVIISGYTKGGEMEEACLVLNEAQEKHSKLSHVTYHTIIRGYCKLGEFDKAVNLLREMSGFGVEPNVDEYNKLIQTLCLKALDFETAEKLVEEMREKGLHLDGSTKALLRAGKEMEEEEREGGGEKEAIPV